MKKRIIYTLFLTIHLSINFFGQNVKKINGFHIDVPIDSMEYDFNDVKATGANYLGIIPYAIGYKNKPDLVFDHSKALRGSNKVLWGETKQSIEKQIVEAKKKGFNVMIKPQIWIEKNMYVGDFSLNSEKEWQQWEAVYRSFLFSYLELAVKYDVEMFCIGTELRKVVKKRPAFWVELIKDIKGDFKGELTYAANWDDYWEVGFWKELDYIGVDAYFPLSSKKTPTTEMLFKRLSIPFENLKKISKSYEMKVLFTEYGYCSRNNVTINPWDNKYSKNVNLEGQKNAFEAMLMRFQGQDWFKGGFIWEWEVGKAIKTAKTDYGYSVQGKPSLKVIKKYFYKL